MPNLIMKPNMSKEFVDEVKRAVTEEYEKHPEWSKYGRYGKSPQMQVRDVLDLLTESVISEWLAMHDSAINAKMEEIEKKAGNIEQMANRLANYEALINNAVQSADRRLWDIKEDAKECMNSFNIVIDASTRKLENLKEEKKAVCGNEEYTEIIGLYGKLIEVGESAKASPDVSVREAAYITWAILGGDNEAIATAKKHDDELTESERNSAKSFNSRRK